MQQRDVVSGHTVTGYREKAHEGPVAQKQRHNPHHLRASMAVESDQRGGEIGDRDALQDSRYAEGRRMGIEQRVQQQSDKEDDSATSESV